jgi:hypothetical protein
MKRCSIIHVYLYGILKREIKGINGGGNIIHIKQINPIIKWYVRLPRKYQYDVIREMLDLGLLKRLGRDNFELVSVSKYKPPIDSLGEPLW